MYSLNREKEDLEDTANLSAAYHSTMYVRSPANLFTVLNSEARQLHVHVQLWQVAVSRHARIGVWRVLTVKLAMNLTKIALQSGSPRHPVCSKPLRSDLL
jgi:hypothetical protein